MKNLNKIVACLWIMSVLMTMACKDDDDDVAPRNEPKASAGDSQSVDLEKRVILDGSASMGSSLTYAWELTDPNGSNATLTGLDTDMPSFIAKMAGTYTATLTVSNSEGSNTASVNIVVTNPEYVLADQMGRPAINTVFNFFGDAEAKNNYNQTLPSEGAGNAMAFEGILDALQEYIGLDSESYTNVLGLDNTTTATVLATDVLGSNKTAASTYGPSDLNNIKVGENVLNGRGLSDDVVDVTLILALAGNDLNNLNDTQKGLISDNVQANDKAFLTQFPYLASPH
ncbi:DUF4331 family protein [Rapidithrix thailandica]|uniref:DUF4331 family protein n=1 Tax=Rapidithrix thailandica TaxID=413964 RepID=A0AAW9RTN7_9BACT